MTENESNIVENARKKALFSNERQIDEIVFVTAKRVLKHPCFKAKANENIFNILKSQIWIKKNPFEITMNEYMWTKYGLDLGFKFR